MQLVLSTGTGVNGFTLDPSLGEFILTHPDIKIPRKGKIYSVNEGNAKNWDEPTRKYVEKCKFPKDGSSPKSLRYIGRVCMFKSHSSQFLALRKKHSALLGEGTTLEEKVTAFMRRIPILQILPGSLHQLFDHVEAPVEAPPSPVHPFTMGMPLEDE
eukprot:Gb_39287 [translate_table: standard]